MAQLSTDRLHKLRTFFADYQIEGIIIPTSDPHLSEYTAAHWKIREWVSGFNGSAGTLVVLKDKAGLWTDSRYFIQATQQLKGSSIQLYKEKLPETPSIEDFILKNLPKGTNIGMDNRLFSASQVAHYKTVFNERNISIISCTDLIDKAWSNRPKQSSAKAFVYDIKYAGVSSKEKIASIRKEIAYCKADGLLLSALDEIAWTLNIRGTDVHCNPVVTSFLLITEKDVKLYIQPEKLTIETYEYLKEQQIELFDYKEVYSQLETVPERRILVDFTKINDALCQSLGSKCVNHVSPIPLLKAVRNDTEITGIHAAMQRDGVAMVKFLHWMESAVKSGNETELSISRKLHQFRAKQPLYKDESFDTIASYGKHAAIVHYSATPETDIKIEPHGFLLIDSGAQYLDGTTDITRTIAVGPLTDEERIDYTLILKGHIDLAMCVFPKGTTGGQLDAFARMPIWQHHKNFLHGTGHGVGHFLCVHEGPQSIRMEQNPVALLPHMLTSNEPGVYIEDKYGIRTENLLLVVDDGEGMFNPYYRFETVTLCPIDKTPIVRELLNNDEITWLNCYHQKVYEQLSPGLDNEEKEWLCKATSNL